MFTVLSNTRNTKLFLISALAIAVLALVTLAVVPAISDPKPVLIPVSGVSEPASDYPDYFQRHSEVKVSTPLTESLERPGMACESPVDCR